MVQIQLVTVEGCPGAACTACVAAEDTLREVLGICGIPMPDHEEGSRGESFLSDGRTIESMHLSCDDPSARGLDHAKAPFLRIDGETVMEGAEFQSELLARTVLKALYPDGLADLRP